MIPDELPNTKRDPLERIADALEAIARAMSPSISVSPLPADVERVKRAMDEVTVKAEIVPMNFDQPAAPPQPLGGI